MSAQEVDSSHGAKSPSTPATDAAEVVFTAKEQRVLAAVWACMKSAPEVDLKKLTAAAGFNTEKTCSNSWGVIKKKLQAQAVANGIELSTPSKAGTSATPPTKTKKAAAGKKRGKAAADEDDVASGAEDSMPDTPMTKVRKTNKKQTVKSTIKAEEPVDDDNEDI